MVRHADLVSIGGNVVIYLFGVSLAVVGALGMAGATELSLAISAALLAVGLAVVLAVHEYLGGPV